MFRFHGPATYTTPLDNGERRPGASQALRFETDQAIMKTVFNIRVYLDATTQPIFEKAALMNPPETLRTALPLDLLVCAGLWSICV